MYHSILKKREEPIRAEDFQSSPNLVFNHYASVEKPDDYSLGLWERLIPYSPTQIYDLFGNGYNQEDVVVRLNAFETGRLDFEISHDTDVRFNSSLTLCMNHDPLIVSSKIVVDAQSQGRGIGRNSMRNWIETSAAFEFDVFAFDAALDDGGQVWAKMGAHLHRDKERHPFYKDDERNLSLAMNARLEAAKPYIGQTDYEQARYLCNIQRPDDLVRLSAMGDITVPRDALGEAASVIPAYLNEVMGNTKDCARMSKSEVSNLSSIFKKASTVSDETVSLPAFLMKKTVWAAVVDFSDYEQMQHVGDYLRGWQTIAPTRVLAMA